VVVVVAAVAVAVAVVEVILMEFTLRVAETGGGISFRHHRGDNLLNVIESYIHCMTDEKIRIKQTDEM